MWDTNPGKKPREPFESLRARPGKYQTQETTLSTGAAFGLRPIHRVHSTHEQVGGDRQIPQRPGGTFQRPSISQNTYYGPDRPIPSVERDLYTPETHQQYTGDVKKAAEQRQFQDRYLGPRIVELDDDPASPAHKRQRIADDVISQSKVTYSPRRMELVPIASRVHHVPNRGPSGGDVQQRSWLTSQEHRVPGAFPETHSEYQQHAISPIQSQPRFANQAPASHVSHVFHSGRVFPSEVHEPSRSLRPLFAHPNAVYTEESRFDDGSGGSSQPFKHRFQQEPIRLKPPHPVDQNAKPFAFGKPATDHTYGDRRDERPLVSRVHNLTSHPPLQARESGCNVAPYAQSSKLDCPMAAQGSFCNRLRENGFTRKDHLDEHMRIVHRMVVYPDGMEEVRTSSTLRAPPRDYTASESSYIRPGERLLELPDTWQRSGNRRADQEQEVVYISSSPLVEDR